MDLEEYRRNSLETWQRMAPGWQRHRTFLWETTHQVGEWLVHALDPRPDHKVLELAAGLGDTGQTLARMLGDEGHLIVTDFSPKMVEAARQRGSELGARNVEYRVMDAENMDLEDDSIDDVLCRWGLMLMADPVSALRETRRVLKPGGRLAFSVWAGPESNPWAATPGLLLVERGHLPPPEPGAPGIFSMADRARIEELVKGAGFEDTKVRDMKLEWPFADFDEYWRFINELAGGIATVLAKLPEEEVREVRGALEERVAPFADGGGYRFAALTRNVVAS
jgi:SAM-dependent methyltransferase